MIVLLSEGQIGKFVLRTQDIVCVDTYLAFNLSHTVGNNQRIHCFNLLFSIVNFARSVTLAISTCLRNMQTFQSGVKEYI